MIWPGTAGRPDCAEKGAVTATTMRAVAATRTLAARTRNPPTVGETAAFETLKETAELQLQGQHA
jgi:hypothetical protein